MSQDEEAPLTPKEVRKLRSIIERDERAAWAWASLRIAGIWVAAVIGGALVGWDALKRIAQAMVR